MTNEYERLKAILEEIDEEQYPESVSTIIINTDEENEDVFDDSFTIASELMESDTAKVMPKCIADYVVEVFLEEIENGNADAMNDLGALYYTGRCGEQDFEKAVKYYTMAAENGNMIAIQNLGYCYYYGRSVEVDYKKAYHYFIKGALNGDLISLYKIGDMYKNGYYVDKDEAQALSVYLRCYREMTDEFAHSNGADICMRMGNAYYYGVGTEIDYSEALKYYQEAERYYYIKIKNGDYFAQKGLAGVIEKQCEIRKKLVDDLPDFEWNKGYTTE